MAEENKIKLLSEKKDDLMKQIRILEWDKERNQINLALDQRLKRLKKELDDIDIEIKGGEKSEDQQ